jgi:ankyrin repeat protein
MQTSSTIPPANWDLILSAAQKNLPDTIQRLVHVDGVDPSHANAVGQSALHIACLWGHGMYAGIGSFRIHTK